MLKHSQTLLGHTSSIYKLLHGSKPDEFYSLAGDGMVVAWELGKEDGVLLARADEQLFSGAFVTDRNLLLLGGFNGYLHWLDTGANTIVKKSELHKGAIYGVAQVNEQVCTVGKDGLLVVWNMDTMLPMISLTLSNAALRHISYLNGVVLVTDILGNLFQIDPTSWKVISRKELHISTIFDIIYFDGNYYTGGKDALLKKWTSDFQSIDEVPAHWYTINSLAVCGSTIVTGSRDKKIRLWDKHLQLVQSIDVQQEGHVNSVNSVLVLPEAGTVVTCSDDRTIRIWTDK